VSAGDEPIQGRQGEQGEDQRRQQPLIRYRSSDLTRLVDDQCECGISTGRLAKIRGRCDEMVVCGMGNVGPWVFDEVLPGITCLGGDWQVVIGHDGSRDRVVLHVEMEDESGQRAVENRILTNLRERFGDFWRNREVHSGWLPTWDGWPNPSASSRR